MPPTCSNSELRPTPVDRQFRALTASGVGMKASRAMRTTSCPAAANGLVELGLPAAGDKNVGALFNEPLCGREADAAATPRDDGDLVIQ
jgi:hypothetical protein